MNTDNVPQTLQHKKFAQLEKQLFQNASALCDYFKQWHAQLSTGQPRGRGGRRGYTSIPHKSPGVVTFIKNFKVN